MAQALGLTEMNAKPGREHEGFLRAADYEIQAPVIYVKWHGADARDGIDDEECSGGLYEFAHGADVVGCPGGAFGRLHEDGFCIGICGQGFLESGGFDHRSVGSTEDERVEIIGLG